MKVFEGLFVSLLGTTAPAFLPVGHMVLTDHLWGKYNRFVNRTSCRCGCWDTFFKGVYQTGSDHYKHVYFNATSNTFKIWLCTVVAIVLLYECFSRIVRLLYCHTLRISMLVLFCSSLYSHYYAWWMLFNYWNDDFYKQWYHQLLFTSTEMVSTAIVVHLMDSKSDVTPWCLVIIVAVAVAHFVTSMYDQFAENVIGFEGQLHQVLRDIGFMYSDVLHICIPLWEFRKLVKKFRLPPIFLLTRAMGVCSIIIILGFWTVSLYNK